MFGVCTVPLPAPQLSLLAVVPVAPAVELATAVAGSSVKGRHFDALTATAAAATAAAAAEPPPTFPVDFFFLIAGLAFGVVATVVTVECLVGGSGLPCGFGVGAVFSGACLLLSLGFSFAEDADADADADANSDADAGGDIAPAGAALAACGMATTPADDACASSIVDGFGTGRAMGLRVVGLKSRELQVVQRQLPWHTKHVKAVQIFCFRPVLVDSTAAFTLSRTANGDAL